MMALRMNAGALAAAVGLAACAAHAQTQSSQGGFDRSVRGQDTVYRSQQPIDSQVDQARVYGQRSAWQDSYDRSWSGDTGRTTWDDDRWFGTDDSWSDDRDDAWIWEKEFWDKDRGSGRTLDYTNRYNRRPGYYPQGEYGIWSDFSGKTGRGTGGVDRRSANIDDGSARYEDRGTRLDENRQYGVGAFDDDFGASSQQPGRADLLGLRSYQGGPIYGTDDQFDRAGSKDRSKMRTDDRWTDDRNRPARGQAASDRFDNRQRTGTNLRTPPGFEDNYGIWGDYGGSRKGRDNKSSGGFTDWYDDNR